MEYDIEDDDYLMPGQKVYSRDGKLEGETTGSSRPCNLEGCFGKKIGVRWPKKTGKPRTTFPCTKGMSCENNVWRIL